MNKIDFSKNTKSFFLKVKCHGCGNEQTVFSSANQVVKCLACNQVLAKPGAGKVILLEKAIE